MPQSSGGLSGFVDRWGKVAAVALSTVALATVALDFYRGFANRTDMMVNRELLLETRLLCMDIQGPPSDPRRAREWKREYDDFRDWQKSIQQDWQRHLKGEK